MAHDDPTMKTMFVIFVLALITITGEIYFEAMMKSGAVAPDPADALTSAVAHGAKRG
jgi:hypothetical protein